MTDLRDLYQDVILEHSKKPRNYRALPDANRSAEGFNPLCGDHFTVFLNVGDGQIRDIAFQGSGCAISKASASMMTQALKGKRTDEAARCRKRRLRAPRDGATDSAEAWATPAARSPPTRKATCSSPARSTASRRSAASR